MIVNTPLENIRKEAADATTIKEWFEKLRLCLRTYGIGVRDIWNMDETGFIVGMLQSCKVLVPHEIKKYYTRNPTNREIVTCVEAVSVAGEFILLYIIIKGKHLLKYWLDNMPNQGYYRETCWTTTQSGYINTEKSISWLDYFDKYLRRY